MFVIHDSVSSSLFVSTEMFKLAFDTHRLPPGVLSKFPSDSREDLISTSRPLKTAARETTYHAVSVRISNFA